MNLFRFKKSSYSNMAGDCVEVALNNPRIVAVRDSKNLTGPILRVAPAAWGVFQAGLRRP
ncbi:DUF397 domain-containing protein [Streptomyces sp. NPDC058391]|uniref:DUF397 domain-containing protein n=1 Tax=Streptomyces sp. NPDC058391 TaxID=3346476 RepID=UPI003648712B